MRLTPNLNGTGRATLVADRRAIYDKIDELRQAVQNAMPNGRDYQLAKDPGYALACDREEWIAFIGVLDAFQERVADEAEKIQTGEV